jgi:hypothetical protein
MARLVYKLIFKAELSEKVLSKADKETPPPQEEKDRGI